LRYEKRSMNTDYYHRTYLGFGIRGWKADRRGDYIEWFFKVNNKDDGLIFKLSIKISEDALVTNGIKHEDWEGYVRDEGLKRVQGRLTLSHYRIGREYRHQLLTTGEYFEPEETFLFPPFRSDEEKVRYYLLKSLRRLRLEIMPDTFRNVQIDVDGLCFALKVSPLAGRAAINILRESNMIYGAETPSGKSYGAFDNLTLYVTTSGLDELERLEAEISERWRESMPDLVDNAFLVLGILYDNGSSSVASSMKIAEIERLSYLSTEKFNQAEDYLIDAGYVEHTLGGSEGSRWLSAAGINWFKSERSKRIPLSIDAMRIARYLFEKTSDPAKSFIAFKEIMESLQLEDLTFRKACQELTDRGLLEDIHVSDQIPFRAVALTSLGRNACRDGFRITSPMISYQQNIGAIFQGPVSSTNVQAIASVIHANIQQAVSEGNESNLRNEILRLIEHLVEQAKQELNVDQLTDYSKAAKELKEEVNKTTPNPTIIQRLLGILEFAGNLDGAIELGQKGLELALKYAPLLFTLKQALFQLIQLAGS